MSQEDVELVIGVFAAALQEVGHVEMRAMIEDDGVWARNAARFSPDVKVRFVTPRAGGVTVMEQAFEGIEGLREGWREWLKPWDEFHVVMEDVPDSGQGDVLVLAQATGRMRGTEAEVPQEVAALCRVERNRIVEIGFYLDQGQARRDAGLG
ncbi:MAG: nuclear transport factor 2 family protein [Actinomycetota bacterium]